MNKRIKKKINTDRHGKEYIKNMTKGFAVINAYKALGEKYKIPKGYKRFISNIYYIDHPDEVHTLSLPLPWGMQYMLAEMQVNELNKFANHFDTPIVTAQQLNSDNVTIKEEYK
jgi:hypothetical protein